VRRSSGRWTDVQMESIIGIMLRTGVLIAAAIDIAGGTLYLIRYGKAAPHYGIFRGQPTDLRTVFGTLSGAASFHARAIIQLGLLILIATPVARVAFSVVGFALERDGVYVVITLVVLTVLAFSLAGGHL
jgi:uncharacterized membrane protein